MNQQIICACVFGLALAGTAMAQTKTSGTLSCAKPDPTYSVETGVNAGHALGLMKVACTWTKPMEIDGVATKDGADVFTTDTRGTKSRASGYFSGSMANGDKIFVRFSGTSTTTKDGKPETNEGSWSYTGGTGKFKGITGKGTYKDKLDASGNPLTEVEGDYTLPAKK